MSGRWVADPGGGAPVWVAASDPWGLTLAELGRQWDAARKGGSTADRERLRVLEDRIAAFMREHGYAQHAQHAPRAAE